MFNNISNIQEVENNNEKSMRNLPEDLDHCIFDEEIYQYVEKENKNTINLPEKKSKSFSPNSKPMIDLANNINKKRRHDGSNFDSFFHNQVQKYLVKDATNTSLNHGFSFKNKVLSNNIDHYELENLITAYQENSNSFTPNPMNKTMGLPKDSPKSINDLSYLKKSQRGVPFKPNDFFSNQTFMCPLPKKTNNKEAFRILQSKEYGIKKNMTCESEKITEILRTSHRPLTEIQQPKQPLLQSKNTYMNLAKKITTYNSKNLKRIKTNIPMTFHFEKPEKNNTYIDILRKTFNKGVPSPRNSSISNLSNKEKNTLGLIKRPNLSARMKTQERKPGLRFNTLMKQPLQTTMKKIPTEAIMKEIDQNVPIVPPIHQKGNFDRTTIPKVKMGQTTFMNRNLLNNVLVPRKEIDTLINSSTNMGLYDKISIGDFKMEKQLGQGSYASVKLAYEKASNKKYAIKIYEKYRLTDPHRMNNVKREISILKKMDHNNIIKLYYALDEKRQIFLIMEYIGHMSLHSYLKSKPGRRLDEKEAKKLFFQIVQAVNYCHAKNIVHRDIKLENILLDENMTIKVIDFGFSITIPASKKLNIFCGTPSYMAPEIVNKTLYNGHATDVWALGILMYVLLHGNFPFKGIDDKDLFRKISKGKFDMNENLSKECKGLIHMILKVNPTERVNTNQILQNSWFFKEIL